MKRIAYPVLWLGMLLVLACSPGAAHAQSAGKTEQPVTPGGETSGMPEQGGMEGMRGARATGGR